MTLAGGVTTTAGVGAIRNSKAIASFNDSIQREGNNVNRYVSVFLALLALGSFITGKTHAQPLPNVVYIMLDDLGPGEFSSYDNLHGLGLESKIATPNIDQLAANGMRFTNAHSATALCAPTRAAVMAGTPIWQTNTRWGFGTSSLQAGQQSVGDLMQAAGYNTALMGKGHLGGQIYQVGSNNAVNNYGIGNVSNFDLDRPLRDGMKEHGYDYTFNMIAGIQARPYLFWEDDLAVTTDADGNSLRIDNSNKATRLRQWDAEYDDGVTEISPGAGGFGDIDWKTRDVPQAMLNKAVGFMQDNLSNTPNEPFFLHYNSVAGHWPYVAPTAIQVDINGDNDTSDPGESYNIDGYDGTGPAPDDLGTESMQMVSVSDAEVGVLVSYLEQTDDPRNPGHKLIDNTMIIYTSDNGGIGPGYDNQFPGTNFDGEEWDIYGHDSTAGLRENKAFWTEGGHRVPFIVQWPEAIAAGTVRDQRISNVDLMGTLAGVTGQSLIDQGQGSHNLLPVFTGERDDSDPIRDNLIVDDTGGASDGLSRKLYYEDNWKLVLGTGTNPSTFQFYDLNTDPQETNDLSGSSDPAIQQRLADMYANHVVERNAVRAAPVFIGKNSTVEVATVSPYTDVDVEGVLEGTGQVNGNLDVNNNGVLRVVSDSLTSSQTIAATQDISFRDGDPNANWDGQRLAIGMTNNDGQSRAALEFDLTSLNVPAGGTIGDVELQFRVGFSWAPAVSSTPAIEVYPLDTAFDETTANWNDPWTAAGGDYDPNALLGTATGFNPANVDSGDQIAATGAELAAAVAGNLGDSQYRLILKYDDASEANGQIDAVWLDSLQTGQQDPQLVITYELPGNVRDITVTGDYTQRAGSTLEISLGPGSIAGTDYDLLDVAGGIDIKGGDLTILLDDGFSPTFGDTFDILDFSSFVGSFDLIQLPGLAGDLAWSTKNLTSTGEISVIAAGDFDEDGDVDNADLAIWNGGFGSSSATRSQGDSNGDGLVSSADFFAWQRTFGMSATLLSAVSTVPEPSTGLLLTLGLIATAGRRRRTTWG